VFVGHTLDVRPIFVALEHAMRMLFYVLGLALALSVAMAQTTEQSPPINPGTPANRIGDGAQTKSGTPAPSSTTPPSTTGGVAGSASSSTGQNPGVQDSRVGVSALGDSDLEGQIQNALNREPTLTGDSPHVTVSADTIELAGKVGTSKEKVTATRIVQSYAGSKKLVNRLAIGAKSEKAPPRAGATDDTGPDRQPSTANPATNPEPGKGRPPSTSSPPQA
jgi:BON domain-containing protein